MRLDPQPDFVLILCRIRRLIDADNANIARVLRVTPNVLNRIDAGRERGG
jgi:hypothetical protein